jgi:hypothetical protein
MLHHQGLNLDEDMLHAERARDRSVEDGSATASDSDAHGSEAAAHDSGAGSPADPSTER